MSEERYVTLGCDSRGQVFVVAYTFREDRVRLISARRAEPREQRQYFEGRR
ncbi:MAG TPA: BrnT family toxin [Thermoanaerobaculia bacterium]|nr:BrnT family toxin [Thermoanaerobaculia bacterium]